MIPAREDLIGRWSEDLGYEAEQSADTTIELREDGSGVIVTPSERIELQWEVPVPGMLRLIIFGNRFGPFSVSVNKERLPLGEFLVLQSSGGLPPFDRGRFTKMP